MRDFLGFLLDGLMEFVLPMVVVVVLLFGGFFALIAGIDYLSCRGFANGTGIETRYEWGCYAKVGERWVPSKYVFGEANEIRVKP